MDELQEYCRNIRGKELELYKFLDPETARQLKESIDFIAEREEPLTPDDLVGYGTGEELADAMQDLISVVQTAESLVKVLEEIKSYKLGAETQEQLTAKLQNVFSQAKALISLFFFDDTHRHFYSSLSDFNQRANAATFELIRALTSKEKQHGA